MSNADPYPKVQGKSEDPFFETALQALAAADDEVGPACMNVDVPPTIVMDDDFREAYVQGYRHALSDARRAIASTGKESGRG